MYTKKNNHTSFEVGVQGPDGPKLQKPSRPSHPPISKTAVSRQLWDGFWPKGALMGWYSYS